MKPSIYLRQLAVGPMQNYAYLAGAAGGGECVVVDPGWDAAGILAAAEADGRRLSAVFLTHGHFDHANGIKDLLAAGELPVYAHEADAPLLAKLKKVRTMKAEETVAAAGLRLQGLHTPGHTPGSQCFLAEGQLFTGDTLFIDCCGRTDLPGLGDPAAMHRSLRRLAGLPAGTMVWPGHDYGPRSSAPMGEVLELNPYLAAATLDEFLDLGA